MAERLDRVVQQPAARPTAQRLTLRLGLSSPSDHRRLAPRLQRQQAPHRPRATHPNRVRPTVDHDPPTPSRIATGPPDGSPSVRPAVRVGLGNPWPLGGGLILVETTGRRSGLPRQVPLVAGRVGDSLVVSTVRADSQWLRNLEADPRVRLWLTGRARSATAQVHRGRLNIVMLTLSGA